MKSLSIAETLTYLGEDKYAVSMENAWYRRLLYRTDIGSGDIQRAARFLDTGPSMLPLIFLAIANWLPRSSHLLLWIDHYSDSFPSTIRHFLDIVGDGLADSHLVENPGILLGPLSSDLLDQMAGTSEQDTEAEAIVSLCTLLSLGAWDAKLLVTDSTDYVEFWEGNVLFYSEDQNSLVRANEIFNYWGLNTPMK